MIATVITSFKTKAAAERECAWYADAEPMNQRVVKRDGVFYVIRDYHPSDEGRSLPTMEVSA